MLIDIANGNPQLTVIDSYQRFMAAGKRADLYRDNVHSSDRKDHDDGAKAVSDALLLAWQEAKPGAAFSTPGWQELKADNLIANGEFSDWKADLPAGWRAGGAATVEKSADVPRGEVPFALALRPNGDKNAF